jgi:hypothetical protein
MYKTLNFLFIFFLCLVILTGTSYSQGTISEVTPAAGETGKTEGTTEKKTEKKTEKTETKAEELKIALEVMSISKLDLVSGKYSAELGIYVQFGQLDLPGEIDYDVFENEIMAKIKEEYRKELEKYYEYDENLYSYVMKEDATEEECMTAYEIIKSSGYYESNLPFELVNGKIEKNEKTDRPKIDRIEDPEDPTFVYYKINAEMSAKLDFKNFPFDSQSLPIKLASPYILSAVVYKPFDDMTLLPEQIEYSLFEQQVLNKLSSENKNAILNAYQANSEKTSYEIKDSVSKEDEKKIKVIFNSIGFNSLISSGVKLPGWTIKEGEAKYGVDSYMKEKFSTFTFPMTLSRNRLPAFMKVFVPLLILMLASFSSLFVGTSVIGNRYTITAGMLLACAMLHLNATSSLPQTGYLTMADKVFISSYLSIFLNVVASVIIIFFNERKKEKNVKLAYSTALWLIPVVTFVLYLLVFSHVF